MCKFLRLTLALQFFILPFFAQAAPVKKTTATSNPISMAEYFKRFQNPHIQPYAFLLSGAVWPTNKIYVCWLTYDDAQTEEREMVKNAVAGTWEANSGLQFSGWQKCAPKSKGIRISVTDVGPYTQGLGKQLDGVDGGMVLNFTFSKWSPWCSAPENRNLCIRSIAIHEFGHAIGFAHEQNRPDKPGECMAGPQGPDGDTLLTPYDKASVMNYCNNIYNKDLVLSTLDISAVQTLYGDVGSKPR